jgi:pantoate--beta-alanine ligase
VSALGRGLCGRFRPGHFRGVATVVAKLFNLVRPHRAYFGLKDYQQALLVKRLTQDLNFNVEVKLLPLVRDRDGLALSSRNAYLSPRQRSRALAIPRSLEWAKDEIRLRRNRNLSSIRAGILRRLRSSLLRIDYVEFVQPQTLEPVKSIKGRVVIAVAGWVGKTRLIDNVIIKTKV